MKKFKLNAFALLLFSATLFTSCSIDDDNQNQQTVSKTEFVTEVTGSETGTINQELLLNVTYAIGGDCGEFEKTVETTTENTTTIEVLVKYDSSKFCTQPTTQMLVYKFKATAAGTYILKFKKTATEFITHTIVIE